MPRGVPQIEITYDLDANGILNVNAAEKSTGKSNKITITNDKGRLSKDQIEKMVASAAEFEAEDKAKMLIVEARNELESYLYNARNSFREEKVKTSLGPDAETGEKAAEDGIQWLESHQDESAATYKEQMKVYEGRIKPLLTKMYSQGESQGESQAGSQGQTQGDMEGNMPGMHGQESGPKVEEVD